MHNVEKCPKILLKSWCVNTARSLKYVWPNFNTMYASAGLANKRFYIEVRGFKTRKIGEKNRI